MKRRVENNLQHIGSKKARVLPCHSPKVLPHGYPLDHPFNKDGYKYMLAEVDPNVQKKEEDDVAGRPIPAHLYRVAYSKDVYISLNDRSSQIKISEDRLTITGDKGYSLARATHGINCGAWYYEVTIDDMSCEYSACRLGWGTAYANLHTPLGYDKHGYSWRSRKGTIFHQSRGQHYSSAYNTGDVLGFLINLPNLNKIPLLPPCYKDQALIRFKNFLHFEESDNIELVEKKLKVCPESSIIFYKNGISQGLAFKDIYNGIYFPCLSIYRGATISINFGPNFKYSPKYEFPNFNAISEAANTSVIEGALSEIVYLIDLESKYSKAITNKSSKKHKSKSKE